MNINQRSQVLYLLGKFGYLLQVSEEITFKEFSKRIKEDVPTIEETVKRPLEILERYPLMRVEREQTKLKILYNPVG